MYEKQYQFACDIAILSEMQLFRCYNFLYNLTD